MKKTKIGGQAVIEGVMMRGESGAALCVRDEKNQIRTKTWRITSGGSVFRKIPVLRGILNFGSTMKQGIKTLMDSADIYGEGEPSNFEKYVSKKFKVDIMSVIMAISLTLGLALAIGLFILLPSFISLGIVNFFEIDSNSTRTWIEGGIRLFIFFMYIILTALIKDIKRVYMYHGAEHKTINCYENEMELTVENVRKCKKFHNRCGTTFLFFVMVVSILVFMFLNFESELLRILAKIALLPLVAGLAYELLKFVARFDTFLLFPLRLPGIILQKVTTKEPDDKMIEVAIAAFKAVLELDCDPNYPTEDSLTSHKYQDVYSEAEKLLNDNKIEYDADLEWIFARVLKRGRSSLNNSIKIFAAEKAEILALTNRRAKGEPLAYIFGDVDFLGYKIKSDARALIPRPETEYLVLETLKNVTDGASVLDLCCGSGVIAVLLAKKGNFDITASDFSEAALKLTSENAEQLDVKIKVLQSDMFKSLSGKFDAIVSNPPYIKASDIDSLQLEVRSFEPKSALDGGTDGLNFYRIIADNAKNYLNENGTLLLEVGAGQADDVIALLVDFKCEKIKDMEGIDRIVVGRL